MVQAAVFLAAASDAAAAGMAAAAGVGAGVATGMEMAVEQDRARSALPTAVQILKEANRVGTSSR